MTLLERRRNVALRDAQREAFHHRRLADARFAGENRVVLAPARENVDDLPDLEIAAQHRIDLALLGVLGQVDGVLIEIRRLAAASGCGAPRRRAGACADRRVAGVVSCEARTMVSKSFFSASA